MNDQQLLRYSRHILLDQIDVDGQQRLLDSHALIVGAGGLGCAAALYLGAAGVGRITLVDDDLVDLTNLQRQIGHSQERVGQSKVRSLASAMAALNPDTRIEALVARADATLLGRHVPAAQVVLDCTDNFFTRHAINAACVQHHVPLVSGSALQMDGQIATFDLADVASPCYACVFPNTSDVPETQCATMGVLAPLVGIVGASQAADALAVLLGSAQSRIGRLRMLDATQMEWTSVRVEKDSQCTVCGLPSLTSYSN